MVKLNRWIMAGKRELLGKVIWDKCADGNSACLELDFHRIEAISDVLVVEEFEIAAGGLTKGLLLAGINRLSGTDNFDLTAGFHLDKNQDIAVTADQIDLALCRFVIAGEYPVTVTTHESARHTLAIGADLRCGRQPRRRRTFVSAETFADELGKGREG